MLAAEHKITMPDPIVLAENCYSSSPIDISTDKDNPTTLTADFSSTPQIQESENYILTYMPFIYYVFKNTDTASHYLYHSHYYGDEYISYRSASISSNCYYSLSATPRGCGYIYATPIGSTTHYSSWVFGSNPGTVYSKFYANGSGIQLLYRAVLLTPAIVFKTRTPLTGFYQYSSTYQSILTQLQSCISANYTYNKLGFSQNTDYTYLYHKQGSLKPYIRTQPLTSGIAIPEESVKITIDSTNNRTIYRYPFIYSYAYIGYASSSTIYDIYKYDYYSFYFYYGFFTYGRRVI